MADDSNAAIRVSVPILKEKATAADFARWRTLARASFTLKQSAKFLSATKCTDLPDKKSNVGTDDAKKTAVKQHEWAVAAITIAMQKNDALPDIIQESVDNDWPEGQMHIIYGKIVKEFAPDDDVGDVAKDDALDKIGAVKTNGNPQDLFDAVAGVRQLCKGASSEVADADMRKQLMKKLPDGHKAAILAEMRAVSKAESRQATYEELKAAVKGHCRLLGIATETTEISLFSSDGNGGNGKNNNMKKKCYCCKKTGHIKSECKKWKKERGNLHCTHCNMKGHTADKCWKLHPELDPTKKKGGGERNVGEHTNTTIECVFASIDLDAEAEDDEFALFSHDWIENLDEFENDIPFNESCMSEPSVHSTCQADNGNAAETEDTSNPLHVSEVAECITTVRSKRTHAEAVRGINRATLGANNTSGLSAARPNAVTDEDERDDFETEEVSTGDMTVAEEPQTNGESCGGSLGELQLALLSFPSTARMLLDPEIWCADSGATVHSTNSLKGATNIKKNNSKPVHGATGDDMGVLHVVDMPGMLTNKHGQEQMTVTMTRARCGPKNKFNLCAITKMMELGWELSGNKSIGIRLTKDNVHVTFDIPLRTEEGVVWCAHIRRSQSNAGETSLVTLNVKKAHAMLGHSNEACVRATAKHLNWKIARGASGKCEACAIGKARQKNLGHGDAEPPQHIGELWFMDGMSLRRPLEKSPFPSNNKMMLLIEAKSGTGTMGWCETKNGFMDEFAAKMHFMKSNCNISFKRLRMDNAGENLDFVKEVNGSKWKFNVTAECAARDSPQQNHLAEIDLCTHSKRGRTSMAAANIPDDKRYVIFPCATKHSFQTRALEVIDIDGKVATRAEHLTGKLPSHAKHLRIFGEAGAVKLGDKRTPKPNDKGKTCMFVCYANNHSGDVYTMLDPDHPSFPMHTTRDVVWLNRMHFPKQKKAKAIGTIATDANADLTASVDISLGDSLEQGSEDDVIKLEDIDDESTDDDDDDAPAQSQTTSTGRLIKRKKHADGATVRAYGNAEAVATAIEIQDNCLSDVMNLGEAELLMSTTDKENAPDAAKAEEEFILMAPSEASDKMCVEITDAFGYTNKDGEYFLAAAVLRDPDGELNPVGATGHDYGNTKELNALNYEEAMASIEKEDWKKAIKTEYDKMKKCNVFEVVHPDKVPKDAKIFDTTWAMKKKPDGSHRARMVIRGFQQVDGTHYHSHDKSSPVVCEVTIKAIFVLSMLAGWYMNLVDVESAFLNGGFQNKEKMHTRVPKGWRDWYPSWALLLLLQCCYGTIQAALQWWRECCKALRFLDYERNESDPCLFYKWIDGKLMVFLLWVDDCCFAGPKDMVLDGAEHFMSLWKCKNLGELDEYVGCKVERLKHACRFTQPVKIQRCYDEFGFDKRKTRVRKTPAKPGSVLAVEAKNDKSLNKKDQAWYSSLVGMFLHVMRFSRPEITNSIRECSQFMRGATEKCKEQIQRTVECVLESPERGYTIAPEDRWDGTRDFLFKITGEADSEYAKDPSRRSVNCGCTYLQGCLVKMFSKMMPIVALSTTEAELFAAVLTAQDMMFVYYIMTGLGLTVDLPMILHVDNKGAVDLANSWSVGGRTRHMDVKQNYLRELKENGFIQVVHRSGEEITPDIGTKNLPEAPFKYHADKLSTEGKLMERLKEKKRVTFK